MSSLLLSPRDTLWQVLYILFKSNGLNNCSNFYEFFLEKFKMPVVPKPLDRFSQNCTWTYFETAYAQFMDNMLVLRFFKFLWIFFIFWTEISSNDFFSETALCIDSFCHMYLPMGAPYQFCSNQMDWIVFQIFMNFFLKNLKCLVFWNHWMDSPKILPGHIPGPTLSNSRRVGWSCNFSNFYDFFSSFEQKFLQTTSPLKLLCA